MLHTPGGSTEKLGAPVLEISNAKYAIIYMPTRRYPPRINLACPFAAASVSSSKVLEDIQDTFMC